MNLTSGRAEGPGAAKIARAASCSGQIVKFHEDGTQRFAIEDRGLTARDERNEKSVITVNPN